VPIGKVKNATGGRGEALCSKQHFAFNYKVSKKRNRGGREEKKKKKGGVRLQIGHSSNAPPLE